MVYTTPSDKIALVKTVRVLHVGPLASTLVLQVVDPILGNVAYKVLTLGATAFAVSVEDDVDVYLEPLQALSFFTTANQAIQWVVSGSELTA